jgi:hypothetical protein
MNKQYVFIGLGIAMAIIAVFAVIELKSQIDRGAEIKELDKINSLPLTSNFMIDVFSQGIHRTKV